MLASTSGARRAMLSAAGVAHDAMVPGVDEEAAKTSLSGLAPRDLADALAELKAIRVSMRMPGALVLGADQVLVREDGQLFDKPADYEAAVVQLRALSGQPHRLISAAVIAEDGRPVWRHVAMAKLTMRALSDDFIEHYLNAEFAHIAGCVGCYRIEGAGAQLFSDVEGDPFTIQGLPLLPLLAYLRIRELLPI